MSDDQIHALPRQLSLKLSLDDEATFENFYVPSDGASGAAVLAHLRARLSDWRTRRRVSGAGTMVQDFTWLWGRRGAGCSHLLQAVCHAADAGGLRVFYLDFAAPEALDPEILQGLEDLDVLCLDHVEHIAKSAAWEQSLFNLYNRLAQTSCALLLAAGASPKQVHFALPDLHSRLQSAAVFHLMTLDDQHKAAALQLRAKLRGFMLGDEVAEYLVRRSERSMTSLFAVLQQLDRHSLETQRKVTVPLLKSLMGW